VASTTISKPYGFSAFSFENWASGLEREREIYSSAAFKDLARSIFRPSGAATMTWQPPLRRSSWARTWKDEFHLDRQLDSRRCVVAQPRSQFSRSTYQTGRTSTEHEHLGSHLGSNLVQAVSSARGRLEKSSIDIGEVLNLANPASCTTAKKKKRRSFSIQYERFSLGSCQEVLYTHQGKRSIQQNHRSW
jgi:hypothetical protein